MARIKTQSIPSELRIKSKNAMQLATTSRESDYVRSRYPWRVVHMQDPGPDVKPGQRFQRDRFKKMIAQYAQIDAASRARWVAANPVWHSYLYGYNFFMMEGLAGAGLPGGPGMIKTIQVQKEEVPTAGTKTYTLSPEIVGAKGVVLIQGSARKVPKVYRGSGAVATGGSVLNIGDTVDPDKCTVLLNGHSYVEDDVGGYVQVYPILTALSSTQLTINWPYVPNVAANIAWEIAEHVEGAVYPVLVSISNTEVVMDWAEVPDAAADVSITVVEYL